MDIFLKVFEETYKAKCAGETKSFSKLFIEMSNKYDSKYLTEDAVKNTDLSFPLINDDYLNVGIYRLRGNLYNNVVSTLEGSNVSFFKGMSKNLLVTQLSSVQQKQTWSALYTLNLFVHDLERLIDVNSHTQKAIAEMAIFLKIDEGQPITAAFIDRARKFYKVLLEICKVVVENSWLLSVKDLGVINWFLQKSDWKDWDPAQTLFATNTVTDMVNILTILGHVIRTSINTAKEIVLEVYASGLENSEFDFSKLHTDKYFLSLLNSIVQSMQIRANSLDLKVDCVKIHKMSVNRYTQDLRLTYRYRELDPKNTTVGHFNALNSLYKMEELEKLLAKKRRVCQILASKDEPKAKAKKIRNCLKMFDKKLEELIKDYSI
jgi:hypothetical protein